MSAKVALITGAARGIGRACATAFAADGVDLVLADVAEDIKGVPYPMGSASQLQATADLCRDHGVSVTTERFDIRDVVAASAAVERAHDRHGRIDVLVNNAGLVSPAGKPVHEVGDEDWEVVVGVDLTGAFRMMRLVLPGMVRHGSGSVVNVASTAGLVGYRHFAGYVAAEHGLIGLTKAAALDYAPHGVRVNAVCPGSVRDDPRLEGVAAAEIARCLGLPADEHEGTSSTTQPTDRLVRAADVAGAVRWLAGDDAGDVTGSVVTVDGGHTAR